MLAVLVRKDDFLLDTAYLLVPSVFRSMKLAWAPGRLQQLFLATTQEDRPWTH